MTDGEREILNEQNRDAYLTLDDIDLEDLEPADFCQYCGCLLDECICAALAAQNAAEAKERLAMHNHIVNPDEPPY